MKRRKEESARRENKRNWTRKQPRKREKKSRKSRESRKRWIEKCKSSLTFRTSWSKNKRKG